MDKCGGPLPISAGAPRNRSERWLAAAQVQSRAVPGAGTSSPPMCRNFYTAVRQGQPADHVADRRVTPDQPWRRRGTAIAREVLGRGGPKHGRHKQAAAKARDTLGGGASGKKVPAKRDCSIMRDAGHS